MFTRTVDWNSEMRVQAIGGNSMAGAMAIGGVTTTGAAVLRYVQNVDLAAAPAGTRTLFMSGTAPRVVRIRPVTSNSAPLIVLFDGAVSNEAGVRLPQTSGGSFGSQNFLAGIGGSITAFDVIDAPMLGGGANTVLVTARCQGLCAFAGQTGMMALRPIGHAAWTTYDPGTGALNSASPTALMQLATGAVSTFDESFAIRAATDGNQFVYLAGQQPLTGALVIVPWNRAVPTPQTPIVSTGQLTLTDMIRGPQGVLVLARLNAAGVSIGSVGPLPYTNGSLGNVVVLRIDNAGGLSAQTWDRAGNQEPVAFEHADGQLAILVNEGPNAVFWRVPIP